MELFYVYGLIGNEETISTILMKHNVSFNVLPTLHNEGFEYEIPITLPNLEFNAAVAEINAVKSCWIQKTRKTDFIQPSKAFIKNYSATDICKLVTDVPCLVYNATLSCSNTPGVIISAKSNCSSPKWLYTNAQDVAVTSEFSLIDLNTLYYRRAQLGNAAALVIDGVAQK